VLNSIGNLIIHVLLIVVAIISYSACSTLPDHWQLENIKKQEMFWNIRRFKKIAFCEFKVEEK